MKVIFDPILGCLRMSDAGSSGYSGVTNDLDPVISQTNTPAVGPVAGDRYLVGTAPTGVWSAKANQIAEWDGAAWVYTVPVTDDVVYITNTLTTKRYTGSAWVPYTGTAILQNGNTLGSTIVIGANDNKAFQFKTNGLVRGQYLANGQFNVAGNSYFGNISAASTARVNIKGAGATGATYALKIDNASATPLFNVRNDGIIQINSTDTAAQVYIKTSTLYGLAVESNGGSGTGIFSQGSVMGIQVIGSSGATGAGIFSLANLTGDVVRITSSGSGSNGIGLHVITGTNTSSTYGLYIDDGTLPILTATGSGLVGIGIGTAGARFHVRGIGTGYNSCFKFEASDGTNIINAFDVGEIYFGASGTYQDVFSSGNFQFGGIPGAAQQGKVTMRGINSANSSYTLVMYNGSNGLLFSQRNDGRVAWPSLQTGNAGLASGELYVDIAATILTNGDKILARKV